MIEALLSILDVLKVPFVKELASDELSQVPNMPLPVNALCKLLKMEIPFSEDQELSLDESMIKGRAKGKVYMPKKPIKLGFKMYSLSCACCGYLCDFGWEGYGSDEL